MRVGQRSSHLAAVPAYASPYVARHWIHCQLSRLQSSHTPQSCQLFTTIVLNARGCQRGTGKNENRHERGSTLIRPCESLSAPIRDKYMWESHTRLRCEHREGPSQPPCAFRSQPSLRPSPRPGRPPSNHIHQQPSSASRNSSPQATQPSSPVLGSASTRASERTEEGMADT